MKQRCWPSLLLDFCFALVLISFALALLHFVPALHVFRQCTNACCIPTQDTHAWAYILHWNMLLTVVSGMQTALNADCCCQTVLTNLSCIASSKITWLALLTASTFSCSCLASMAEEEEAWDRMLDPALTPLGLCCPHFLDMYCVMPLGTP